MLICVRELVYVRTPERSMAVLTFTLTAGNGSQLEFIHDGRSALFPLNSFIERIRKIFRREFKTVLFRSLYSEFSSIPVGIRIEKSFNRSHQITALFVFVQKTICLSFWHDILLSAYVCMYACMSESSIILSQDSK